MQRWNGVVFLQLLTCAVRALCQSLSVSQSPSALAVSWNGSVTLNCSFQTPAGSDRVRVEWIRQSQQDQQAWTDEDCPKQSKVSDMVLHSNNTESQSNQDTFQRVEQRTWYHGSALTLNELTPQDSGRYFCRVILEIPTLQTSCGNGTLLCVEERPEQLEIPLSHWVLWLLVGLGALGAVLGAVWLCRCLYGRWRRRSPQLTENQIYENMVRRVKSPPPPPPPRSRTAVSTATSRGTPPEPRPTQSCEDTSAPLIRGADRSSPDPRSGPEQP
ncbi:hypothetical protein AOXY_G24479 [Acipenser oxyrinchus oxyrinchus]|uniref:Ig-like domain-containing protein n=1 Tax=Acipenser oxyrinchus oxyrinchus TaxID=40147 RepID=A0AAD8CWT3_ACIOX|nr:hypothetical protein AOXY_G24479 [Acipenser oxyrinchus oxyrinchus]